MNKKGELGDSYGLRFGKEDIKNMEKVAMELKGSRYEAVSSIYKKGDKKDTLLAEKGTTFSKKRFDEMRGNLKNALNKNKSSPYYSRNVTKE